MFDDDPVSRFVQAVIAKSGSAGRNEDARFFDEMKQAFTQLDATETGRLAFRQLLHHQSVPVRLWVAAQLLSTGDKSALAVLEALAAQQSPHSFEAQVTLAEHEKGRLGSPFGSAIAKIERTRSQVHSYWRGPASDHAIKNLTSTAGVVMPEAYIVFLRSHNGGEGEIQTEPGWVSLWPAEEVVELNAEYRVSEYFPGYLAFGSDGGGEMLAFEVINGHAGKVVMLPFVGDVADAEVVADAFEFFVAGITTIAGKN